MKKTLLTNQKVICAELNNVQNNKMTRTLTYDNVVERANVIIKHFQELGVAKKNITCDIMLYSYLQNFPRAYKYTPYSTFVRFNFVAGKAYIVEIGRRCCQPNSLIKSEYTTLSFTDEMRAAFLKKALNF